MFNRHAATVYRLCYSFLGSAADAEDATQSVFMKLIARPRRFNDAEHEKAWLIVCAQNHCRDVLKSAHRTRQAVLPEDIADERRAQRDETLDAVLALPEKYKTCVYLFYYEGYRTAEIAALTGVPASTVRSHLSEARALLKTMLGGERHGR
ncbi:MULTISPECIES: RNA polymerase sigma factor [Eggerthella]|uniref:RNA polymerase sigma factor n=1 Tax=Eggerthella TaxID=84111 RepID=UPI001D026363|nr:MULTISPECIES: sigma-70 family RNA polymerase sigma factor [Eggerthella]MCB5389735.1 sigma-70 family RNA polymerase sigma factor [Eggerthella lenta]MDU5902975.1 sigma-70 family RNA polymerase sigma factor [Eggerthella sp.]MDU5916821.1 sigma-70 family RNA polymerase sigma factor [Eggerthella sp.]MDU5981056.1 sigma-70 family RNA polymerase sigma factor [Eggerthella sp.]MDU8005866.1 sigma-70 family RNA polymerase sigma factor [Eggerthella sp.]